jgi:hypothetical protein
MSEIKQKINYYWLKMTDGKYHLHRRIIVEPSTTVEPIGIVCDTEEEANKEVERLENENLQTS